MAQKCKMQFARIFSAVCAGTGRGGREGRGRPPGRVAPDPCRQRPRPAPRSRGPGPPGAGAAEGKASDPRSGGISSPPCPFLEAMTRRPDAATSAGSGESSRPAEGRPRVCSTARVHAHAQARPSPSASLSEESESPRGRRGPGRPDMDTLPRYLHPSGVRRDFRGYGDQLCAEDFSP